MTLFKSISPGAICGLLAVILATATASTFAQTTLPSAPPVAVKYSPPTDSTILQTTFVAWDSLTVRFTPVGQNRFVWNNPTPTLEKIRDAHHDAPARDDLSRRPSPPVGGNSPHQGRPNRSIDQWPKAPRRARLTDFLRIQRSPQHKEHRRHACYLLCNEFLHRPDSHRPRQARNRTICARKTPLIHHRLQCYSTNTNRHRLNRENPQFPNPDIPFPSKATSPPSTPAKPPKKNSSTPATNSSSSTPANSKPR